MKRIIVFALVIVLLLTLTACGDGVSREEFDRLQEELSRLTEGDGNDSGSDGGDSSGIPQDASGDSGMSEQPSEPLQQAEIGHAIEFAGITWIVLDIQDDKALIISDEVLEERPYVENANMTFPWEGCDLRLYLNGEFYDNTFSSEEKARIIETTVINDDNPEHGTDGGNDTVDKVFVLSVYEAQEYFQGDWDRVAYNKNGELSEWWLRTPGDGSFGANCRVSFTRGYSPYAEGPIDLNGWADIAIDATTGAESGVRPAMWITGASSLVALPEHPMYRLRFSSWVTIKDVQYSSSETTLSLQPGVQNITDEDIKSLSEMVNLTELYIVGGPITDISPLAGLTKLEKLDLSNCQISDISPLAGLTNLKELHLQYNQINDISALAGLTNLTTLFIHDNQISDVSPLAHLDPESTTLLYVFNNPVTDWSPLSQYVFLEGRDT